MTTAEFEYSPIPARALAGMKNFFPDEDSIAARYAAFADVAPRPGDSEGDTEVLDGVTFTHHFVDAPGDHETVRFHYVEAGSGEPVVFLHGLPDSWYQWHHQMAALAGEYRVITKYDLPDDELRRTIQEFSYPGIDRAVPRYFHSSTFRQEWIQRRRRLLRQWTCPVLLIQGYESKTQPREYYANPKQYLPNVKDAGVVFIDAGHFWSMERPDEVTEAIRQLLKM
jgi:pimeloyl-ACP methyl ester carboxylesterase